MNRLWDIFSIILVFQCALVSCGVMPSNSNAEAPSKEMGGTQAPAFLDSLPLSCPEIARKAKMEGTVWVKLVVGESGDLVNASISAGVNPMLNRAALDAAWGSRFLPAVRDGVPVQGELLVPYTFDLERFYRDHIPRAKPPIDWSPPLISHVGEFVEYRGSGEKKFGVYSYNGVEIYGDMTLALFEQAIGEVSPHLNPGEIILYLCHLLAYKDFGELGYIAEADLEVMTCSRKYQMGDCHRGRVFKFLNKQGSYTLLHSKGTQVIWAE